MEQDRIESVNSHRREPPPLLTAKTAAASTNDDGDELEKQRANQQQRDRHQSTAAAHAGADIYPMGDEWAAAPAANEDDLDGNNESSSSVATSSSGKQLQQQQNRDDQGPVVGPIKEYTSSAAAEGAPAAGATTDYIGASGNGGGDASRFQEPPSVFTMDHYFSGSLDSTRMRLVKLVHRIAPELSCYTGNGEHYRGNVSVSADKRPCMSWSLIRSLGGTRSGGSITSFAEAANDHHNHCRNPNKDPRGPWCFVQYKGDMLDEKSHYETSNSISGIAWTDNNSNNKSASINSRGTRYVANQCSISPCSEYLWLYIVAPPLGLLVLLSCLVAILIKSIRKSHYQAMFSTNKRRTMPRFNRLLSMRSKIGVGRKFGGTRKKCGANYLDEDIFEIVDDLDWSDGQTQSLSPKSTTESLKLNSSFSSASTSNDAESRLLGCKSTNPIFCDGADRSSDRASTSDLLTASESSCANANNKSVTQVGPMFATLRCHIRGSSNKSSPANQATTASRQLFNSKLGGPRDQGDLESAASSGISSAQWLDNQLDASSSSSDCKRAIQSQQQQMQHSAASGSHLISCSSTIHSRSIVGEEASLDHMGEKFIKGTELPQLNSANLVFAACDQQPIFEGKFSQVHLAYIEKSHGESNGKEAPASAHNDISFSSNHHQVAVCSLKANAAIDQSTLKPSNLKLRNLNHLNLLKLVGYSQLNAEIGLTNATNAHHQQQSSIKTHSLIYDMAQLTDLSDWLKQQNKDIMTCNEPAKDLRIRRNLTCFAKQLALAIDYLHDQGIIYRDLACRNCFLDPTKMLVKLASFNIELVNDATTVINDNGETTTNTMMKSQSLRSMIRPKYLLDYYVIDSRPADCQLLPLSWIPLESILFNKFNKQTDVWSFGCLLYELFSLGKVAYFGYSSKQIIDAVRSNLMPPQPLLCPNGVYKLMCKCLSDIPSIRPNVKQVYEQLNLFSGQCSSFLDHHLCSLATTMYDDQFQQRIESNGGHLIELKSAKSQSTKVPGGNSISETNYSNSITKTKSYANIRNFASDHRSRELSFADYDNVTPLLGRPSDHVRPEMGKIPMSKSINLAGAQGCSRLVGGVGLAHASGGSTQNSLDVGNHYDEPVMVDVNKFVPKIE